MLLSFIDTHVDFFNDLEVAAVVHTFAIRGKFQCLSS